MSSSTLLLSSSHISCFQEEYCFQACWDNVLFTPVGSTTANFGPRYQTVSTSYGQCTCSIFNINGATTTSNSAMGSSPDGVPFSRVQMFGYSSSDTVSISWTAGSGQYMNRSCSASYYVSSGAPVLGAEAYYFGYWWAVLVGIIVFVIFCCAFGCCCGICGFRRRKTTTGATLSRASATQQQSMPVAEPNMEYNVYTTDRPQYAPPPIPVGTYASPTEGIPVATAVPVPVGTGYPSAVPQPIGANNSDTADRQLAVV